MEKLREVDAVIITLGYEEYKQLPLTIYDKALVIDITGTILHGKIRRFYTSNTELRRKTESRSTHVR